MVGSLACQYRWHVGGTGRIPQPWAPATQALESRGPGLPTTPGVAVRARPSALATRADARKANRVVDATGLREIVTRDVCE
jgi:hypothetical protein